MDDFCKDLKSLGMFMPEFTLKPAKYLGLCEIHGAYEVESVIPVFSGRQSAKVAPAACPQCEKERGCVHSNFVIHFSHQPVVRSYKKCLLCGVEFDDTSHDPNLSAYNANVPKCYGGADYALMKAKSDLEKENKKLIDPFIANIGTVGADLIFLGGTGSGKTYTACAILNSLSARNRRCKYITLFELLNLYKKADMAFDRDVVDFIDEYASYDTLVIDEIGSRKLTDKEFDFFSYFVDIRTQNQISNIFITNLSAPSFYEFVGDRSASRIRARAQVLNFGSIDRRRTIFSQKATAIM